MTAAKTNLADWLGEAVMTVLGVVLAFIPLALWFAWSEASFFLVLGIGGAAFVAVI